MIGKVIDTVFLPAAKVFDRKDMGVLGVNSTMKVAKLYTTLRYGKYKEYRLRQHRDNFPELIRENGAPAAPVNVIKDGWVIDTSGRLPYLEELLRESNEIIKERSGVRREHYGRPFFQELITDDHFTRFPSILNFATSSDVLTTVCSYLGTIPVLSYSKPNGVRLIESWKELDDTPDAPFRQSQLFHQDYHDKPMAYAIVVLRDVSMENGPFCFLPKSLSDKANMGIRDYHTRKGGHRVSDEKMYSLVPEDGLIKLCYPAGTVLFLDSNACFHYGSRNAIKPRYLMMFAYLSPCRADFGDLVVKHMKYPADGRDSRLRRLVLDREYLPR